MTENASPPTPDEQPTVPLEPVGLPSPAPDPAPAPPVGPATTAYPAAGQVPPRRGMPGWAVAASVVGGIVLLGIGFAGGLGTGLLLSHRSSGVVERADLRGSMSDRFGQGGAGDGGQGWTQGGRPGDRQGQLGGGRARQGDNGVAPSPGTDGSTTNP